MIVSLHYSLSFLLTPLSHTHTHTHTSLPSTGELDDIPEVAFYMVGPIEEVLEVAEKLAQQQQ